jgi:hypothetical protein
MIRLVATGSLLALGSVAQAMPLVQLQAADPLIGNVREPVGLALLG